ncbi:MAG: winged helix DNA-binding domain-containing protein [Herpetosiphon sp.]
MTPVALQRLLSQQLIQPAFADPRDVVAWFGAIQAQDYLGALWAVALRTPAATERTIERALSEKTIVRTWPMRGTIHFVAAADVRWMLELLAPRVVRRTARRRTDLGLDEAVIARSADLLSQALQGGKQLTRPALYACLEQANIATGSSRGLHILWRLAHDRLLCFGARDGKQPTFALLDEWIPATKSLARDEAIATLTLRYFTSHGPATIQDFMWWSGLTTTEARVGLAQVASQLRHTIIADQKYYVARDMPNASPDPGHTVLLPPFDEFLVAYRDRSAVLDPHHNTLVVPGGNGIFNPIIVIDGHVAGTWKRAFKKDSVIMTLSPFSSFSDTQLRSLTLAAEHYGRFVGKQTAIVGLGPGYTAREPLSSADMGIPPTTQVSSTAQSGEVNRPI